MKIYDKYKLNDPMKRKAAQREIVVLKKLNHTNVIKLLDLIDLPKQIRLVTEYVQGFSLQAYVKSLPNRTVKESTARKVFK
mmetsp:Transcript_36688/g.26721  ORF Transcript_36688/g.26721 Transcript_36688/m.26721 type:complete len:81 (+) Transcript_36688:297-539(+)